MRFEGLRSPIVDRSRGSVALVALLLVGCAAGGQASPPSNGTARPSASSAVESPSPAPSPGPTARPYEEVEFSAEGGPTLRGRVSEGRIGVVLAHGFSPDSGQESWDSIGCPPVLCPDEPAFAGYLAGLGYGVLTFDFRGFCDYEGCSEGSIDLAENWRDVVAAVAYLRSRGSERIFIVAASMGGIETFRAADEAELDLAGIVSLATPQFPSVYYAHLGEPPENDVTPERLQRIAAPKLFIAGADDVQTQADLAPGVGTVRFADEARSMYQASREPRQLEIVDSSSHSSVLVTSAGPDVVEHTRELIVAFIEEHA
jgi:pimeloyl-ACP methyl ester carboxylesterase